jgi:hypothetical protein
MAVSDGKRERTMENESTQRNGRGKKATKRKKNLKEQW